MLGRNNFGSNVYHFYIPKFKTKRQVKKILRQICGRHYPLSAGVLVEKMEAGGGFGNSFLLMLNKRGIKKMVTIQYLRHDYENLEHDFWNSQRREERGETLEQQAWAFMSDHYKHDWKMKEPK
jgi:hypothetical protein